MPIVYVGVAGEEPGEENLFAVEPETDSLAVAGGLVSDSIKVIVRLFRKGEVFRPEIAQGKSQFRKEYYEEELDDKVIDDKIEWYDSWNYPVRDTN